jgi:hypothetical protein
VPGPDPSLAADITWSGHLDPAVFQIVAPVWRDLRNEAPGSYSWFIRDGSLRVRLHGSKSEIPRQKGLLEERAAAFPCVLAWTPYRRSHQSLGGGPFLEDDRYAALLTRCLGEACALVLSLEPEDNSILPHRRRQVSLLRGLIAGLGALGFSPGTRASYHAYHRDWLVRFLALDHLPRMFEERVQKMGSALDPIRTLAAAEWTDESLWGRSLADLLAYVTPFSADPAYRLDPFAPDPAFSPLFKVFHGLGNQLGLSPIDEAFAHHLLLQAATKP